MRHGSTPKNGLSRRCHPVCNVSHCPSSASACSSLSSFSVLLSEIYTVSSTIVEIIRTPSFSSCFALMILWSSSRGQPLTSCSWPCRRVSKTLNTLSRWCSMVCCFSVHLREISAAPTSTVTACAERQIRHAGARRDRVGPRVRAWVVGVLCQWQTRDSQFVQTLRLVVFAFILVFVFDFGSSADSTHLKVWF